jgi:hypothetical protein
MIKFENLTDRQKDLLDELWRIESMEELDKYLATLGETDFEQARALVSMLALESAEMQWKEDNKTTTLEACGAKLLESIGI